MPDERDNLLPSCSAPKVPGSLFESTSAEAGRVAAKFAGVRYIQILAAIDAAPNPPGGACIFEVAKVLGCFDHQISGRFGELVKHNLIIRTGQRREKPSTGCECDVYNITTLGLAALAQANKATSNTVQTGDEGGGN